MTQFEAMRLLSADRSSWYDLRHYPETPVCRRMLELADYACADPARWSSCRIAFECPELSCRELAVARGVSHMTIARHITPVEIGGSDDYKARECDCERPAWLQSGAAFDADHVSATYRRAMELCTFACVSPMRWRVIRIAYSCPQLSQQEIADRLRIGQQTVSDYLKIARIEIKD